AISSVGMILRQTVGDKGILCRSGGDEFIILAYIKSQQEIMDIIDTIKKEAALFNELEDKPYKIHFSIGYSTYETKNETIDDFLKKMDDSMYEDKRRRIEEKAIADRRQNP
ncbi:MAG TPA: diguanylate cyclase, partial [Mogibacterium sp.]|nr:diguanylate cyclase [Mogibacterium sp.]